MHECQWLIIVGIYDDISLVIVRGALVYLPPPPSPPPAITAYSPSPFGPRTNAAAMHAT